MILLWPIDVKFPLDLDREMTYGQSESLVDTRWSSCGRDEELMKWAGGSA